MAEQTVRDDSDVKKRDRGGLVAGLNDQLKRTTSASSDFVGGVAEAFADGLRSYNLAVTADNVMAFGLNNGMIEGTVAGYARFFERMAETARSVLEDIQKPAPPAAPAGPDPTLLAKQIAEQLTSNTAFLDAIAARVQAKK